MQPWSLCVSPVGRVPRNRIRSWHGSKPSITIFPPLSHADLGFYQVVSDSEINEDTPVSLLHGLREQDDDAWTRLVDMWTPLLFGFCRSKGFSSVDADDIVQAVMIRVYRGLPKFCRDGKGKRFRFWILTILRNEIADFYKRKANGIGAVGGSDNQIHLGNLADSLKESDSDWFSPARIMTRLLDVIRHDFSEQNWRAFELVHLENHSNKEAAEKLGIKENAVRQATHRIRKRIAEETPIVSG